MKHIAFADLPMKHIAFALALAIMLATSPAYAAYRITWDPGGSLVEFIQRFTVWRDSGAQVRIDGMCISACTLLTGLIPSDRVCVTERARLAFHSASQGDSGKHSSEGTRLGWHIYPERVRELLLAHGWNGDAPGDENKHQELIYIEGEELRSLYRTCAPSRDE